MPSSSAVISFSVAALAAVAKADLGKTLWESDGLGPHFVFGSSLPGQTATYVGIDVPAQCTAYATASGGSDSGGVYCAGTMTAINVTYPDCSEPWTFCRCDDAQNNFTTMVQQFGRVPVNLRDYVRYVISFNGGESAFSESNDMVLFGDESTEQGLTVLLHEAGHDIDQGETSGDDWTNAVNADSCATDAYGDTSLQEEFAQINVVSLYIDLFGQAPDGKDTSCIQNQLNVFQSVTRLSSATMTGTTTCDLGVRGQFNNPPSRTRRNQIIPKPVPTSMAGKRGKRAPRRGLLNN